MYSPLPNVRPVRQINLLTEYVHAPRTRLLSGCYIVDKLVKLLPLTKGLETLLTALESKKNQHEASEYLWRKAAL